jgi:hypothetical protein
MSKQEDDERRRTLLDDIQEEALLISAQYQFETSEGGVTPQTERQLRQAVIRFYAALRKYRHEPVVEESWNDSAVDEIKQLLTETTTIRPEKPGHGSARGDPIQVPIIQQVGPHTLNEYIEKLDDLYHELGLSDPVKDSTPRTEINDELIEEVEEWRKANL